MVKREKQEFKSKTLMGHTLKIFTYISDIPAEQKKDMPKPADYIVLPLMNY